MVKHRTFPIFQHHGWFSRSMKGTVGYVPELSDAQAEEDAAVSRAARLQVPSWLNRRLTL